MNTNLILKQIFKYFSVIFKYKNTILIAALLLSVFYFSSMIFIKKDLSNTGQIQINYGESLGSISETLESAGVISNQSLFRMLISFWGGDKDLKSGIYSFNDKTYNLVEIARKISSGQYDKPAVIMTIPEGFTLEEISNRVNFYFPNISKEAFYEKAYEYNGYLFPNTYYFNGKETVEEIVSRMVSEFKKRYSDQKLTHDDIVLASLVEGEAKHMEDMRVISGILKNRLKIDMRLQVDVELWTYKNIGIPPDPINNPGDNSIQAVLNPLDSEYIYYITGNDGKMYYAKTLQEHNKNIDKYLK